MENSERPWAQRLRVWTSESHCLNLNPLACVTADTEPNFSVRPPPSPEA